MKTVQTLVVFLLLPLLLTCSPIQPGLRSEPRDPLVFVNQSGHLVPVIRFDAEVSPETVFQTQRLIAQALEAGAEAIVIEWNSPGGQVDAGFLLSKTIEDSPVPVVCVVDGDAASMAYYILQSCHQRLMTKRSSLLIHGVAIRGEHGGGYIAWKNIAERIRIANRAIIEHCAARTKLTADEMEKRVFGGQDWWLDWREALDIGAVDGVVPNVKSVVEGLRKDLQVPAPLTHT